MEKMRTTERSEAEQEAAKQFIRSRLFYDGTVAKMMKVPDRDVRRLTIEAFRSELERNGFIRPEDGPSLTDATMQRVADRLDHTFGV